MTLRREVLEETGMRVSCAEPRMQYHSTADVPCNISVFRVEAEGEIKESWEGSPRWMTFREIEPRIINSQRPVLGLMQEIAADNAGRG